MQSSDAEQKPRFSSTFMNKFSCLCVGVTSSAFALAVHRIEFVEKEEMIFNFVYKWEYGIEVGHS